jgi:hypothetical protein
VDAEDACEDKTIWNDDCQAGGYHVKSSNDKNQKLINISVGAGEFDNGDDVTEIMFNDVWSTERQP